MKTDLTLENKDYPIKEDKKNDSVSKLKISIGGSFGNNVIMSIKIRVALVYYSYSAISYYCSNPSYRLIFNRLHDLIKSNR